MLMLLFLSVLVIILLLNLYVFLETKDQIIKSENLPFIDFGLVLGAGLEGDGSPTDILADRVLSGVKLVNAGKAGQLIMSGSVSENGYNEVAAMVKMAVTAGTNPNDILKDEKGISTLDSLINYKNRYPKDDLLIITQSFHLPRSLWLANRIGLKVFGFAAHLYEFSPYKRAYWHVREIIAIPFNLLKLLAFRIKRKERII